MHFVLTRKAARGTVTYIAADNMKGPQVTTE